MDASFGLARLVSCRPWHPPLDRAAVRGHWSSILPARWPVTTAMAPSSTSGDQREPCASAGTSLRAGPIGAKVRSSEGPWTADAASGQREEAFHGSFARATGSPSATAGYRQCPGCDYDLVTGTGQRSCGWYECPYVPEELKVTCPDCNYNFATGEGASWCGEPPSCRWAAEGYRNAENARRFQAGRR
jgi:hypothetical protein